MNKRVSIHPIQTKHLKQPNLKSNNNKNTRSNSDLKSPTLSMQIDSKLKGIRSQIRKYNQICANEQENCIITGDFEISKGFQTKLDFTQIQNNQIR